MVSRGLGAGAAAMALEAKKNRMLRLTTGQSVPNRYLFTIKSQLAF